MTLRRDGFLIPLVLIAAALGGAGCGDDESDATTPSISIPSVTAPGAPSAPTVQTTDTATEATTTTKRGSYDPGKPDSPENDVPPPAGSPQEAFEKMCEQNPEACG